MPVHVAGPRLYKSIKLDHINKSIHGHARASNVASPFASKP